MRQQLGQQEAAAKKLQEELDAATSEREAVQQQLQQAQGRVGAAAPAPSQPPPGLALCSVLPSVDTKQPALP
jgi:hypothetical protein